MSFGGGGALGEIFSLLGRDESLRLGMKTLNELIESDQGSRPPVRVRPSELGDAGGSNDKD